MPRRTASRSRSKEDGEGGGDSSDDARRQMPPPAPQPPSKRVHGQPRTGNAHTASHDDETGLGTVTASVSASSTGGSNSNTKGKASSQQNNGSARRTTKRVGQRRGVSATGTSSPRQQQGGVDTSLFQWNPSMRKSGQQRTLRELIENARRQVGAITTVDEERELAENAWLLRMDAHLSSRRGWGFRRRADSRLDAMRRTSTFIEEIRSGERRRQFEAEAAQCFEQLQRIHKTSAAKRAKTRSKRTRTHVHDTCMTAGEGQNHGKNEETVATTTRGTTFPESHVGGEDDDSDTDLERVAKKPRTAAKTIDTEEEDGAQRRVLWESIVRVPSSALHLHEDTRDNSKGPSGGMATSSVGQTQKPSTPSRRKPAGSMRALSSFSTNSSSRTTAVRGVPHNAEDWGREKNRHVPHDAA